MNLASSVSFSVLGGHYAWSTAWKRGKEIKREKGIRTDLNWRIWMTLVDTLGLYLLIT